MKKGVKSRSRIKKKLFVKKKGSLKKGLIYRLLAVLFIILIVLIIIETGLYFFRVDNKREINFFSQDYGELKSVGVLKIENPVPNGSIVSFFVGEDKTFSILNKNYERIEWYIDGKNIKNGSSVIKIKDLPKGNHTLQVSIINASQSDSRMWKIIVEDVDKERKFIFDSSYVLFWAIIIVLVIIMFLLIWLIVQGIIRKKRRIKLDLQVIGEQEPAPGFIKKKDMSKRFNIPH